MKDKDIGDMLMKLQCDMHITQILLAELVAQSPNPQQLLRKFQQSIDDMTQHAPQDVATEQLVELRARAAQTTLILSRTFAKPI